MHTRAPLLLVNEPAGHAAHVGRPVNELASPGLHGRQLVLPGRFWYVPFGQA